MEISVSPILFGWSIPQLFTSHGLPLAFSNWVACHETSPCRGLTYHSSVVTSHNEPQRAVAVDGPSISTARLTWWWQTLGIVTDSNPKPGLGLTCDMMKLLQHWSPRLPGQRSKMSLLQRIILSSVSVPDRGSWLLVTIPCNQPWTTRGIQNACPLSTIITRYLCSLQPLQQATAITMNNGWALVTTWTGIYHCCSKCLSLTIICKWFETDS